MALGKLESDLEPAFTAWQQTPTPDTTTSLLTKLQPTIDRGIAAHVGSNSGTNIRSHAKKITLQALQTYNPYQSRLGTHVINHLQGLKRVARQSQQIIQVPERVSMDQAYVDEQKSDLADRLGREPSDHELADHSGISMKRLRYIRQFRQPMAEGTLSSFVSDDGEGGGGVNPAVQNDSSSMVMDAVYHDLDGINQKIMEWSLGLHGHPVLQAGEIARRLGMTSSAISQRRSNIQANIEAMHESGLF